MDIKQDFTIDAPRETVWAHFKDVRGVASAVPGAEITEELGDDKYKGKVSVKLGPMLAAFRGEFERKDDPESWSGVVTGKGSDAKSGSRVQVRMTYSLEEPTPGATKVNVVSNVMLSGALAQFGRSSIINDISARITAEFAKNFQARIEQSGSAGAVSGAVQGDEEGAASAHSVPTATPGEKREASAPMNAGGLVFKVIWARIAGFFGRLFGRG